MHRVTDDTVFLPFTAFLIAVGAEWGQWPDDVMGWFHYPLQGFAVWYGVAAYQTRKLPVNQLAMLALVKCERFWIIALKKKKTLCTYLHPYTIYMYWDPFPQYVSINYRKHVCLLSPKSKHSARCFSTRQVVLFPQANSSWQNVIHIAAMPSATWWQCWCFVWLCSCGKEVGKDEHHGFWRMIYEVVNFQRHALNFKSWFIDILS